MATGRMTRHTDLDSILILTALSTRATGKTIFRMVRVWNHGKTAPATKVATRRA